MIKISYAGCPGLSLAISAQFTVKMCAADEVAKNTKTPYFGGSRSLKVIDVHTVKSFVTSACYDKQHSSAYLQPFSR